MSQALPSAMRCGMPVPSWALGAGAWGLVSDFPTKDAHSREQGEGGPSRVPSSPAHLPEQIPLPLRSLLLRQAQTTSTCDALA